MTQKQIGILTKLSDIVESCDEDYLLYLSGLLEGMSIHFTKIEKTNSLQIESISEGFITKKD